MHRSMYNIQTTYSFRFLYMMYQPNNHPIDFLSFIKKQINKYKLKIQYLLLIKTEYLQCRIFNVPIKYRNCNHNYTNYKNRFDSNQLIYYFGN